MIARVIRLIAKLLLCLIALVLLVGIVGGLLVPDVSVYIRQVVVSVGGKDFDACVARAAARVPELSPAPQFRVMSGESYFKSSVFVFGRPISFLARQTQPGSITLMALGGSPIGIIPWYPDRLTSPVLQSFSRSITEECK